MYFKASIIGNTEVEKAPIRELESNGFYVETLLPYFRMLPMIHESKQFVLREEAIISINSDLIDPLKLHLTFAQGD